MSRDETLVRAKPVKLKSFSVCRSIELDILSTPRLTERIAQFARAAKPFLTWGWKAIDAA